MLAGNYFVYITTNPGRTVLYTGVTNDLRTRMQQHYENRGNKETFAGRYYCYKLVYYERFSDVNQAIAWEKEVKDMSREKKEALIRETNPRWDFLRP
ncbi:MAG: GIY-YIG nuclease family protein [Tunicatimonas sp.]